MTATQAPTPGPLSGDDELIERGLRSIRTYDAVRSLRDALTATTARLTGYDWNADPDAITLQQGDAFAAADRVFSDLDAAVAAHPEIDLPECEACNGTGKIEEPARTEGANQHSACVRSCDECDGCGFAPDERLAPTAPVEASGSGSRDEALLNGLHARLLRTAPAQSEAQAFLQRQEALALRAVMDFAIAQTRPQPSGETREGLRSPLHIELSLMFRNARKGSKVTERDKELATIAENHVLALLSARPLALGGQQGEAAGCAEPQVGRAVYERIEKLLTTNPQGWERDYLCHLVESVEELGGYDGPRVDGRNDRQTVADFLKLRDENVGPGEADDSERLESADAILDALSTPPARAEAQDEGAAVTDCASCFGSGKDAGSQFNACPECDGKGRIARTHPSPTPAADADRVRTQTPVDVLVSAMKSALKSTAAKEGGAK